MKCIVCNEITLTGLQRKYCSNRCKGKSFTGNSYENQQKRAHMRKAKLISMSGGKCELCGYSKNTAALCFHHIDSTTKKFPLDARNCSNRRWKILLEEHKKCQLLCANCHLEVHNPSFFRDS